MNNIKLNGVVKSEPTFSHSSKGEDFFKFEIEVIRKSGNLDILNCVIPSCYADRIKADDSVRGFVFEEKTVLHTEESQIKTEDEEVVLLWQDAIHKNHLKYLR